MDEIENIITSELQEGEESIDSLLRPKTLSEYVGQEPVKEQLSIFIEAAKKREESLDHVLIFGPPGLGKTTLAHVISNELGVNLKHTSGPAIEKPGDLAAILTNLEENDVLFVDEIHRLSTVVEEILYPALEDYKLDIKKLDKEITDNVKSETSDKSIIMITIGKIVDKIFNFDMGPKNIDQFDFSEFKVSQDD